MLYTAGKFPPAEQATSNATKSFQGVSHKAILNLVGNKIVNLNKVPILWSVYFETKNGLINLYKHKQFGFWWSYKQISSEYWKFIAWSTLPVNMSQVYWILFAQHGFKNSRFYKECMSSLALLPPRDFAVFERQFLPEYYTQRAKTSTMY